MSSDRHDQIHNREDLRYRMRLIAQEIKNKELAIKGDLDIMRSKLSLMSLATEGLKLGVGGVKDVFKNDNALTPVRQQQRLGLLSSVLKFGTYKLSNLAAEKLSEGISGIFGGKKNKA